MAQVDAEVLGLLLSSSLPRTDPLPAYRSGVAELFTTATEGGRVPEGPDQKCYFKEAPMNSFCPSLTSHL